MMMTDIRSSFEFSTDADDYLGRVSTENIEVNFNTNILINCVLKFYTSKSLFGLTITCKNALYVFRLGYRRLYKNAYLIKGRNFVSTSTIDGYEHSHGIVVLTTGVG